MTPVFHLHTPGGLLWHNSAYASRRPGLRKNLASGALVGGFWLADRSDRRSTTAIVYCGERGRGNRYCEVVQLDQGLWIYTARQRRQGCLRAHFGRGKSRPEQP